VTLPAFDGESLQLWAVAAGDGGALTLKLLHESCSELSDLEISVKYFHICCSSTQVISVVPQPNWQQSP
jgi:hypothetical protein